MKEEAIVLRRTKECVITLTCQDAEQGDFVQRMLENISLFNGEFTTKPSEKN